MATNFHLAPPPKTVDGLAAVPIDIQSIDAELTFDGAAAAATADATITYTVGPTGGNPIFDLRQNITQAWLDGGLFPVAQLAHHVFGGGVFTDLRVIQSVQSAGSVHTLRVQYPLALPNSQLGGSYLPALEWSAGPKLRFVFGLSDLNRARYAEAWLPANLVFDQYSISLEVRLLNTLAAHSVITNGAVTPLGTNHWRIEFPERFTALSPMLEVRASDTLVLQTDTVVLPVSGKTVSIEAWKVTSSAVNLGDEINKLKSLLADNENNCGPYLHGNRFVAFFNGISGMEYEGGTTTSTGALAHETFHSWYARGIKPAAQADGWWDEGFTTFYDDGANDALPFDFSDPPVLLCSRDPWQRHTAGNSYGDGSRFWKGVASMLGAGQLNALMRDLYVAYQGEPVSTAMIEEFLLCKTGNAQLVDAFHRFVYGLPTPASPPDLWLKDDTAHSGADQWGGAFWDSPDLWIRNTDDGGTTHQSPEYGQDNWFHARVRNRSSTNEAAHFVVTFHSKGFAGTQFEYPGDFLPCIAARADFDLGPGQAHIVKARWPRALVPPAGSHTCLLASVITRSDQPIAGSHVWEHNNLVQKNLTVVDLLPNSFLLLPVVIANWAAELRGRFSLDILKLRGTPDFAASLVHSSKEFFRAGKIKPERFTPFAHGSGRKPEQVQLECGGYVPAAMRAQRGRIVTSGTPDLILERYPKSWEVAFPSRGARLFVDIPPFSQNVVGLKLTVPLSAKPGQTIHLHLVQRSLLIKRIVGGVAIQINVIG